MFGSNATQVCLVSLVISIFTVLPRPVLRVSMGIDIADRVTEGRIGRDGARSVWEQNRRCTRLLGLCFLLGRKIKGRLQGGKIFNLILLEVGSVCGCDGGPN